MLKSFIYRLLETRHFWRYASFSEIAELYASRTLRIIAMHIASGFASVYLLQTGYSLSFILLYWACYFMFKVPLALLVGKFVAYYGPKHGILISNLLYIPAMVALGFVPNFGFPAIIIWGVLMACSATLYQVSYHVDFSKIKSVDHGGKELGFMNILEKMAIGISPIVGGLIALIFGAQVIMWVAAAVFAVAAIPLFQSAEQTRTHQRFTLKGFPFRMAFRSFISQIGIGFDVVTTGHIWNLFIAIVIFPNLTDELYLTIGSLSAVTILTAIVVSYAYGKLIDRRQGGNLLKMSVIANGAVHAFRPFASGAAPIVGANVANELATTGVTMAYMRGLFDTADLSGHRVAYLSIVESIANFGGAIACFICLVLISILGDSDGLRIFFFVAAGAVLIVGTAHFRLYRK